ncbi:MAG TPA: elongation factor G [Desulfovibrio sp.]|uniref:elongation factor G n=1 Tax=Desulfovibrio sp. TaxID=885 RepID=UPI002BC9D9E1|nr:elongation factor G [Desulfovibrio sp.]HMM38474.1 elongation factor G [Desulfovibrio sp.]
MSKKKPSGKYLSTLRNIGIIAHIDAGKTTLTERILYYSGRIHRIGEVHEGTATMDYMPEEQERGITITSAVTTCPWRDCLVNIIDTPGHVDFTIEVERSLRVLDGAVGVFCGVSGVQPQSETVWRQSEHYRVPKIAFVNKLDRPGADFSAVLESITTRLRAKPLALTVPDGEGPELRGIFDLIDEKRLVFDQADQGVEFAVFDWTEEERAHLAPWREKVLEAAAEEDDALMERYLSGEVLAPAEIRAALRKATLGMRLVPVLAGSALKNVGVQPVMDAICHYLPGPAEVPPAEGLDPVTKRRKSFPVSPDAPLSALAFKVSLDSGRKLVLMRLYSGMLQAGDTVYNSTQGVRERVARLFKLHAGRKEQVEQALAGEIVAAAGMKDARTGDTLCQENDPVVLERIGDYRPVISVAIEPRNSEESGKLDEVLEKYLMEDPTLAVKRDEETGQVVLSGMGELHLEVILERMSREFGLAPRSGKPQVVYQETVGGRAEAFEEFHRELGEVMHYGGVRLSVEPLTRDSGRDVVLEVDGQTCPAAWLEAVVEGVSDGLQSGVIKGYPVQDVRVRVLDLARREGESSPAGYRMAAAMALKKALAGAQPLLLEPIMWVEIGVPDDFVGEVVGLLGAKGAKIENLFDRAGQKVIQALAPLSPLFGFSTDLRSATQGRAGFVMKFSRFDVLD